MEITGKIAIITGASSGIGEATARLLASKGAKVILAARSKDKLESLSKELPDSFAIVCDMTKEEDVEKLFDQTIKKFGMFDILINNAGQGYDASIEKTNLKTFRYVLELDVLAPLSAMQKAIPFMKKQKEGAIVNISSGTALMALPNMAAYSSAKRALAQISLTAQEELKSFGISVSVVYPYITDTDFEKNTIKEEEREWEGKPPAPPDSPEYVAGLILQAIETGKAEIFAHDFMDSNR